MIFIPKSVVGKDIHLCLQSGQMLQGTLECREPDALIVRLGEQHPWFIDPKYVIAYRVSRSRFARGDKPKSGGRKK